MHNQVLVANKLLNKDYNYHKYVLDEPDNLASPHKAACKLILATN